MTYRYRKHYTREEARALLPLVRKWLEELTGLRNRLRKADKRLSTLLEPGCAVGGDLVNSWVRLMVDVRCLLLQFQKHQVFLKDIDRGLVDFPAIIGGKEVFLCWEQDEEDIEFWHDLGSGYAGRERLGP